MSQGSARLPGADALRAALLWLGVAYHAGVAYVPEVGRWYLVTDASSHPFFGAFTGLLHAFRLDTFFLLAALLARRASLRRPEGFVARRARRLLVPYAVALPLVVLADVGTRRLSASWGLLDARYEGFDALLLRPLHLWFLPVLFVCTALAFWCVSARPTVHPAALLALVPVTGAVAALGGEPRAPFQLVPDAVTWARCGVCVLAGWMLDVEALRRSPRLGWLLVPGLGLGAWLFAGPWQWSPAGPWLGAAVTWLSAVGLLALAAAWTWPLPRAVEAAAEASYWVYLVHLPLVYLGHVVLAAEPWPAGVKYALVLVAVTLASSGSWMLARRVPSVRAALGPA